MPGADTVRGDRWKRLISMDGAELLDRIRQQIMMRADVLRYRAGFGFGDQATSQDVGRAPKFFFRPDAITSVCSILRQRFPEETRAIVQRAGRICEHHFDLLGYADLNYGSHIDWHSDLVHKKRAPRKPWFQIRYLDFDEVGDSKVTWELNRHQHFVTLAKAYRLSGDARFANEVFDEWRHWHAENPYSIGINWASSLEVAFRSLSWIWTYYLLSGTSAVPEGFRQEWLHALSVNGRHIECYLSTYFSPNTHLLGEGVALFFIGTMCPELPSARRWQQLGWQIVEREAERQVQADGLHFEQSTYYHVYALDLFLHAGILATVNDLSVPAGFDARLERMLHALCLLTRAGAPPRFGDDDGGRVFDPRRNRAEHMVDPLATGAVLFGRGDFKAVAGGLREETLWLLGEQGVAEFDRLPAMPPDESSAALQAGGLYFMGGPHQQLVVDAGPQGASSAGHGHADALSLCLNRNGRSLLIDPGACEYVGEERRLFRSTAFHNTLQVDGHGQAHPKGPFSWTALPHVQSEGWVTGQTFDLFVGSHDGYRPVIHRRWVFSLKSRFWVVRDLVLGEGEHRLDLFWHLDPELSGKDEIFVRDGGREGLRIIAAEGHDWRCETRSGWHSPVYGKKEAASVLHFGTVAKLPAEFVTLLLPVEGSEAQSGRFVKAGTIAGAGKARAYHYETAGETHFMSFGSRDEPWSMPPWSSDAEFMYLGHQWSTGRRSLILCNGSYLEAGGKKVVSYASAMLRCEILVNAQAVEVFCSDENVVVMKDAIQMLWPEPAASTEPVSGGAGS
jgi:hypothetical protein